MASENKTPLLGLNLWEGSDIPQRADFVADNQQLESLVGAHVRDAAQHLTTAQAGYLAKPLYVFNYAGDGVKNRYLNAGYTGPRLGLVFCNHAPVETDSKGYTHVYWDFWTQAMGKSTSLESDLNNQGGLERDSTKRYMIVHQDLTKGKVVFHLNESGLVYTLVTFPSL